MIIGIDVGGTHTDGVLLDADGVRKTSKVPTRRNALDQSVLNALDALLTEEIIPQIHRIVFSTTLTTNLIAQKQYPPVGLVLIPGPGLPFDRLLIGSRNWVLSGSVDHRGRKTADPDEAELASLADELRHSGIRDLAVVGKFSTRNPLLEEGVEAYLREHAPQVENIQLGHRVGGGLNFPRRVQTTWLNTAVHREYSHFLTHVEAAVRKRGLAARLLILKADGGTMPLEEGLRFGVETIQSGPAASIMGFLALCGEETRTALLLDIGGSTTDLALMKGGAPLFEPEGVQVGEYLTSVRGLLSRSLPYGGDSPVIIQDGRIALSPVRRGAAVVFGGSEPTLTDALAVLKLTETAAEAKAFAALGGLVPALLGNGSRIRQDEPADAEETATRSASPVYPHKGEAAANEPGADYLDDTVHYIARSAVQYFCSQVRRAEERLLEELRNRPVYTIHELITETYWEPEVMLVVGGPAEALAARLGAELSREPIIPDYHFVANALGAGLAQPTLRHTLYADTAQRFYTLTGVSERQRITGRFTLAEARRILLRHIQSRAADRGDAAVQAEITREECFQIVRGFTTQGQILKLEAQVKPGITQLPQKRGGEER